MSALLAAGMAVQAIGGLYSGYQQQKGMYQEANDLELSANETLYRQKINEDSIDNQSQSLLGSQIASVASSGALVNTGSPLAVYSQSLQDAAVAKANSRRETEVNVAMMRTTAQRTRKQAKKVMIASTIGAAGGLLQAGSEYNKAAGAKTSKGSSSSSPAPSGATGGQMPTSAYNGTSSSLKF